MNISARLGHPTPRRVVVLRALQLGDLLCSVPAFRALRAALPGALITLVGLPWAREFVKRFDFYLDDFIEFPGFPGLPERPVQIERLPQFLTDIQWLDYDLAIQMQGSGRITNLLIELFGAKRCAGFTLAGEYTPDAELFLRYPAGEPEPWRHLRLMEFLGFPLDGDDLEFPLFPADWEEYACLAGQYGLQPNRFVCIHPGSRAQERRWAPDRFAVIADALVERGYQVILTGTREEIPLTLAVQEQMKHPATDLAGQTTLGSLGALLSEARLLVCNDTGVSHVASALRTPSVVLFTSSEPERWAPLNHRLHRVVTQASQAGPEVVLDEVADLLGMERAYAD